MEPTEEEIRDCTCGIVRQADYAAIREREEWHTHSPYCPVGRRERDQAYEEDAR